MQIELTKLDSKAKGAARHRILAPLLDESRERSATLLKIIALLLFTAAGLVYFTVTVLSQSDRDQGRKMSHVPFISHPAGGCSFDRTGSDDCGEVASRQSANAHDKFTGDKT